MRTASVLEIRTVLAAFFGAAVGALAALAAVRASYSPAQAVAFAAAALAAGGLGLVGALWLEAARPRTAPGGALVVFALFAALGLMLGAGGHASH
jgi:hypothetical protein